MKEGFGNRNKYDIHQQVDITREAIEDIQGEADCVKRTEEREFDLEMHGGE